MGEMADYISESYEWGRPKKPKSITCKHCGEKGLRWVQENQKWVLYNGTIRHKCSPINVPM